MKNTKEMALFLFDVFKAFNSDRKCCIIIFANEDKKHVYITNEFDSVKLAKDLNSVMTGIDVYKKEKNN